MAFFDAIGKRLSDAGQSVAQQTRNLADVNQLNSAISDREKRICQLLSVLGRSYYERHKADPNAEDPDVIDEINSLYLDIRQKRDRILQIKGIALCENCGAEMPAGVAFCKNCGSQLRRPEAVPGNPSAQRRCPGCDTAVGETDQFCIHCGTKL